jgi:hypothetical protein
MRPIFLVDQEVYILLDSNFEDWASSEKLEGGFLIRLLMSDWRVRRVSFTVVYAAGSPSDVSFWDSIVYMWWTKSAGISTAAGRLCWSRRRVTDAALVASGSGNLAELSRAAMALSSPSSDGMPGAMQGTLIDDHRSRCGIGFD